MNLWVDDVRVPPSEDWKWVTSAEEAIAVLRQERVERVSLDHDLGDDAAGTGYDVAVFIESEAHAGRLRRLEWSVHSANPVGAARIRRALQSADRWWSESEA